MTKQEFQELTQNIVLLDGCRYAEGGMHRGMGAGT